MRRFRLLLCSAAALASAHPAAALHAQRAPDAGDAPFHALVLTTGMSRMSVEALNARTTAAQFAPLSNDAVSYGASAYFAFGRALLGAEAHRSTYGEEGLNSGRTGDLGTMQGLVTASYALVSRARLTVFPQLGVGLGRVDVTLRDRDGGPGTATSQPTFDEVAQSPGAESRMSGRHLLYSFGGGVDHLVTRRGSAVGVVMGLRAGVLAAPNRTTWTREGETVVAGPDASAGGPFLRVVVGLGGR